MPVENHTNGYSSGATAAATASGPASSPMQQATSHGGNNSSQGTKGKSRFKSILLKLGSGGHKGSNKAHQAPAGPATTTGAKPVPAQTKGKQAVPKTNTISYVPSSAASTPPAPNTSAAAMKTPPAPKDTADLGEPGANQRQTAMANEDYFGDDLPRTSRDTSTADNDDEGDEGELCGADPDASIRPITPSSIDAASSFTGSVSLHSQAPTSRTFKSFVTGHSKASGSTKPTTASNALSSTGAATASQSEPASPKMYPSRKEYKGKEREKNSLEGMKQDMQDAGANRIATSVHEAEGEPPLKGHGARTSETQQDSAPLTRPILPGTSGTRSSLLRNSYTGMSTPDIVASDEADRPHESGTLDVGSSDGPGLRSSASITFSALPPTTPSASSTHLPSLPGSPLLASNASTYSKFHAQAVATAAAQAQAAGSSSSQREGSSGVPVEEQANDLLNYPRHSQHDPKNNPRASSPPPDNASMVTLASSTGPGREGADPSSQSVYTTNTQSRMGRARSSYLGTANEDASIRAIAPSRRDSDASSLDSRWSAAILSNKENANQGESGAGQSGVGDGVGYRKKTPSMRTVATSSSYYAVPQTPSQAAPVEIRG